MANFFVKSTLRGRNLESAVMDYLSKELTYAAVLPANMRTAAARRLAVKKSADTLRFYRAFLDELKDAHGMDFRVRTVDVPTPGRPRPSRAKVSLVLPASCGACGGKWETDFRTEKGLKCEKLEASIRCGACGDGARSPSACRRWAESSITRPPIWHSWMRSSYEDQIQTSRRPGDPGGSRPDVNVFRLRLRQNR